MQFLDVANRRISWLERQGAEILHEDDQLVIMKRGHLYAYIDHIGTVNWHHQLKVPEKPSFRAVDTDVPIRRAGS